MPKKLLIVVLFVLALSAGIFYALRSDARTSGVLKASGTIEATTVNVAPEIAGRVSEVLVSEGQSVHKGDVLLRLDGALLEAQRAQAQAALEAAQQAVQMATVQQEMAQAQYDAALAAARAQEGAARLQDWVQRAPGLFDQPLWYFTREEQLKAAQREVETAARAVADAEAKLQQIVNSDKSAAFVATEERLNQARIAYQVVNLVYQRAQATGGKVNPEDVQVTLPPFLPNTYLTKVQLAKRLSGDSEVIQEASDLLDAVEQELQEAQKAYDALLTTQEAQDVLRARAALSVAQERYNTARDWLQSLQTGEHAPQVRMAAVALEQAKAALLQSQAGVRQAQANLALLETQMQKLTIYAPRDGVILSRAVEPGEFLQPGATALTLADLSQLTVTVYIPEDRYGQLHLGQAATIRVDSFPGETFQASIVYISDQAEFTPRNVQTVEGRSTTVYAVKLRVEDSTARLKPGMPADVFFEQ